MNFTVSVMKCGKCLSMTEVREAVRAWTGRRYMMCKIAEVFAEVAESCTR